MSLWTPLGNKNRRAKTQRPPASECRFVVLVGNTPSLRAQPAGAPLLEPAEEEASLSTFRSRWVRTVRGQLQPTTSARNAVDNPGYAKPSAVRAFKPTRIERWGKCGLAGSRMPCEAHAVYARPGIAQPMHGESTEYALSLLHTQVAASHSNADRTLTPNHPRIARVGRNRLLAWL